jgi:hypothetical protein
MAETVLGYPVRPPYPGERAFFAKNPRVAGMAAEDGAITLNPGSGLSAAAMESVARNEAVRLHQRDQRMRYSFPLTQQQESGFRGSAYESDPQAARQTVVARILSGDPSAGDITEEQRAAAAMTQAHIDMLLRRLK